MEVHGLLACWVALCLTVAAGELRYDRGQRVVGKGQEVGGKWQDVGGKMHYLGGKGQEVGSGGKGEGWLSRLVSYYKRSFLNELQQLAPIHLQASIKKAPAGYKDSTAWDFESVARLLGLLRADEDSKPVRVALRRALRPSGPARRFMSKHKSYKYFPSLQAMHQSNFYYDMYDEDISSSKEDISSNSDSSELDEEAVLQIQNPVEARLPSASISIRLLKAILEARAKAARAMPPTKTTPKLTWRSTDKSVTTTAATSASKKTTTALTTSLSTGETTPDPEVSTLSVSISSVEPVGDTTINN